MSDKLVTNSIANAAITGNVISSGVITGSKIASGAITLAKLEPGFATKFAAGVKITNLYYDGLNTFADVDGGQTITLVGSGFTSNSKVVVNKSASTSVTVTNQYFLTFLSPPNPRGSYSVFVDNQNGATSFLPFAINYIPLLKFYSNSGAFGNLITPDNSVYEQISAIGDGTLVYTLESGALPSGIVVNANGTITGTTTVTSVGNYNFNVSIFDNNLNKIYRDFYMTLAGGVRVTGTFYNAAGQGNLSASTIGGNVVSFVGGPFVTGGNVVIGSAAAIPFTFSNSTTISFTTVATTAGTYDVRINNTNGTYAFRRNFFTVRLPVTWVTAAGALTGTSETATYNSNVSATSDGAITYSIISGALPLGLTFFANGAISGTVTGGQIPAGQSTVYNFTVNAVCINGQNQTRSFSITVNAVPAIYNYTLPGVVTALNTIGGETVTVNGFNFGVGAVAVVNGINATTNRISVSQLTFTSPAISSGTYTIRVRNSDGALSNTTTVTYSIAPSWTTAQSLGNFFETQTYTSIQLIATSDSTLTYTLASGSLPSGLSLSSTGFITGVLPLVVVETGYSFTVTVTDAEFQTNSRTFSMTVILGSKLLSLSPAIAGKSSWNLKTDGDLAFPSFGTYTLTSASATFFVANVKVYGAGGGDMATNERSGGLGGYTTGVIGFEPGVSYTVIVGEGGDATLTSKFAGGGAGGTNSVNSRFNAGSGGGYSGLFYSTTVTQSTALLVAGGGGGGRGNRGGGGGGDSGETGESSYNVGGGGGTQSGPGGGGYFGPGEGTAGASGSGSTGGTGGDTGGAGWAGGGGGGGGYYGGGGGGGGGVGGAGGGGSGFVSANVSRVKFGYSITSQTIAGVHGGANQYPRSIYTGAGIQTFNGLVYITSNIVGVPTSVAVSSNLIPISYLVVGGGGGGGARIGGGGGAGGAIYGNVNLPMNTYPIIVGGGGAQKISSGSDSTFHIFTANGGGRGGTNTFLDATGPSTFGADGGSGGGGSGDNTANGQTGTPDGTGYNSRNGIAGKGNISKINFLQGNPGTTGYGLQGATPGAGGGGGGASASAGGTDGVTGGTGGAGILWINGSYYAGGGGGGANSGGTAASGGVGGGGAGTSGSGAATSGTAFTGGGGGGGGASGSTGGSGGSGVVIVAYSSATVIAANLVLTGGNIATLGNLTYHTFTTSGNLTIASYDRGVDLLLVAGGGGGGGAPVWGNNSNGGGGGAGGYRYIQKVYPTRSTVLTITVGAGGGGADGSTANPGSNGSDSSAFGLSATGGGGGGSYTPFNGITAGSSGGSGGGGGGAGGSQGRGGGSGNAGGYTPAEGNAGGSNWANDGTGASGGGGGAGAVGANGAPNAGGAGGAGLANPFSEVSVGQFSGGVYYLAGGGGGAGATGGSGGLGGGGTANRTSGTQNIPSGLTNTGGGGGGRGQGAGVGGTGGSGVVVIKELTTMYPAATTGNVQVTTSGFYRFYTFYESGTIFLGEPSNMPDAFIYLAVAGGGGGGSSSISPLGGGGGGGGIAEGNVIIQKGASYTITVGAGGTASSNNTGSTYVAGSNGGNTSILSGAVGFGNIVAIGGGCGGSRTFAQGGFVGGSGGGAAGFSSVTTQTGASGITGGSGGTGVYQAGGGGGGASGATGGSGIFFNNKYTGGTGGAGKTITSLGPDSSDFRLGSPWQYAGGGGAGGSDLGGDGGAFASFGGGYGGRLLSPSQNDGNAGAAKSGGGGGGGLNGGNGGSGRVIIRTLLSVANATISGSVIYSQDAYYRSYAFDGTGTITWN